MGTPLGQFLFFWHYETENSIECVYVLPLQSHYQRKHVFEMEKKKKTECFFLQSPIAIFICLAHLNNATQNIAK